MPKIEQSTLDVDRIRMIVILSFSFFFSNSVQAVWTKALLWELIQMLKRVISHRLASEMATLHPHCLPLHRVAQHVG
jgi:hypothetical protein